MVESGYPDFVMTFWTGVVAPAGTPQPVVARLNARSTRASSGEMKGLARFQVEPRPGSPETSRISSRRSRRNGRR